MIVIHMESTNISIISEKAAKEQLMNESLSLRHAPGKLQLSFAGSMPPFKLKLHGICDQLYGD